MAEKKNILETIGSAILSVPKAVAGGVNEVAMSYVDPDYKRRAQAAESQNQLSSKLEVVRSLGGPNTEAGRQAMSQLMQDPQIQELVGNMAVAPEQLVVQAKTKPESTDPLELERIGKIFGLQKQNIDATTRKPRDEGVAQLLSDELSRDEGVAQLLSDELSRITGVQSNVDPATGAPKKKVTLADMLAGYSQDTDRKGWFWNFGDDTISPESIKAGAKNYVELQKAQGTDEQQARKQATKEYANLMASEKGSFQKYPKIDIAQLFENEDTRKTAVDTGKAVVVDTGDGVDTTPVMLGQLNFDNANEQELFLDLENEVAGVSPELNIRTVAKNPIDYQDIKKLLQAVADKKITMKRAAELIKGAFGG